MAWTRTILKGIALRAMWGDIGRLARNGIGDVWSECRVRRYGSKGRGGMEVGRGVEKQCVRWRTGIDECGGVRTEIIECVCVDENSERERYRFDVVRQRSLKRRWWSGWKH